MVDWTKLISIRRWFWCLFYDLQLMTKAGLPFFRFCQLFARCLMFDTSLTVSTHARDRVFRHRVAMLE